MASPQQGQLIAASSITRVTTRQCIFRAILPVNVAAILPGCTAGCGYPTVR